MSTAPLLATPRALEDPDQRVILDGIDWWQFETHGGIDKLEVDRGLGVREVWIWKNEELKAYELRGGAYVEITESAVIPGLAPSFIWEFLDCETQTEAVRRMRATLRK